MPNTKNRFAGDEKNGLNPAGLGPFLTHGRSQELIVEHIKKFDKFV
jgi:hypothetical protein